MGNRDDLDRLLASASNRVAGATVLRLDDFVAQRGAVANEHERFELPQLSWRAALLKSEVTARPASVVRGRPGARCAIRGEPVACVAIGGSTFCPPDLGRQRRRPRCPGRGEGPRARDGRTGRRSGPYRPVPSASSSSMRPVPASATSPPPTPRCRWVNLGRLHTLAQQHDVVVVLTCKP